MDFQQDGNYRMAVMVYFSPNSIANKDTLTPPHRKGKEMRTILGIIMVVGGILAGLYVGIWVCFIGGIIQVIEEIRAEHLSAMNIAIGIARIMFSGLATWISGIILVFPGLAIIDSDK